MGADERAGIFHCAYAPPTMGSGEAKMAGSLLSALHDRLTGSRRRLAEAAEDAQKQLFAEHLTNVLSQLAEGEQRLLHDSALPVAEK